MIERLHAQGLLRGEGERDHQVSSMELFFDLVFVFAPGTMFGGIAPARSR